MFFTRQKFYFNNYSLGSMENQLLLLLFFFQWHHCENPVEPFILRV